MRENLIIIAVFFAALQLQAQEVQSLTKAEVLQKVKTGNTQLKIAEKEVLAAKAAYQQTAAVFLPQIKASHTGMATTNPLMAFGSKLNQEILTQADFNPARLNNPSQIQDFQTKVEVQMPLVNLDGIYQRKAAKFAWQANQLQQERTAQNISLQVEKAYMQLQLAYKTKNLIEKSLAVAEENLRVAKDNQEAGYLQQADVLMVNMRVTELQNKLQFAKSNIQNSSNYLSVLMNEPQAIQFKPADSLEMQQTLSQASGNIENRSDILAMQRASEAKKKQYQASKMNFLPRLNAFGSYEWHDDEIFQAGANGYLFGAELSWNLFDGGKRFGKTKESKARFQKARLEAEHYRNKSQLELQKAKRQKADIKNQVNLAEMAIEQAKEALRIRTNRFEEGLEKTTELLQAEVLYAQKQMEYFQSIYEYNYAAAYLRFLTNNK